MKHEDMSALFGSYVYSNLIKSLLMRKQGRLVSLPDNGGAVLAWGPSVFIGGEFSEANGEMLVSVLSERSSPRYINYPDEKWRAFIENTYADRLKDCYLNLYMSDNAGFVGTCENSKQIVEITRDLMEKELPSTEILKDELYSYIDMDDFYHNGYGLALIIDGAVCGYCLSEYSVDNGHGINIWIDEKHRRKGYAGKMAKAFLAHCGEKGNVAYWACNADNIPSNRIAVSAGLVLKNTMHYFEL